MEPRALIVVDVQNDFVPGGALAVREGDRVVPVINRILPHFAAVVATQDWHPADHLSFAANHPGKKVGDRIDLAGLQQILWPPHCVQGTKGAEFVPALDTRPFDAIIRKGTDPAIDSYSAFFDNGRRKPTGLEGYLRTRGISDLFVCGLATDYCVKVTALDALSLGFKTHLIADACHGVDLSPGDCQRAVDEMLSAGVHVVKSGQISRDK